MKSFRTLALSVMSLSILLSPSISSAQTTNAAITGRITDPSKAVLVDAHVAVINTGTNVRYEGRTNNAGSYVIPGLPPGPYRVEVEKSGFRTIIEIGVVLHVQDTVEINYEMALGTISESITVTADTNNINTTDASVSTVIDRNFVESLPLNGRSFNTLLQLTPGVVIAPPADGFQHGQFSIAGERTDANSFTVDGVSANFGTGSTALVGQSGTGSAQAFSALGGTSSLVSLDALQEFRIETSSFAPEFGRSPGGQVILTTRSGTNEFHGAVFDYFRNTVMDANNWFSDAAIPQLPKSPEHHNNFGGVFGGPIWKDKTFFFASYEGARLILPATGHIQVPYFGSTVPGCSPSATVSAMLGAYPKPNGTVSSATCTGGYTGSYDNRGNLDAGSLRIDHTFNGRFSIFGRYSDAPSQLATGTYSLSDTDTVVTNTKTLTVGVNMALSSRLFNALRGNYSTQQSGVTYNLDSLGGAVPPDPSVLIGTLPAAHSFAFFLPLDGTQDYAVGPNAINHTKQLNFVDDLSLNVGTHQLKFGGDYRAIFLDNTPNTNEAIYVTFSIQNLISSSEVFEFAGETIYPSRMLSQAMSLYAQDSWKAAHRLVLTYGVRWELSPAPKGLGSTKLASWLNVNNPSAIALAPSGTPLWQTTYGNFAPRLGIAYRLDRTGSMVLRVGGGVFYDLGVSDSSDAGPSWPNSAAAFYLFQSVPISNIRSLMPTPSVTAPYPSVSGYDPNMKLPHSYQWNVALEKSFVGRQAISATYIGQAGRSLTRQASLYQPNANFSSSFTLTNNSAWSNYNAFQLQYRRPLASRIQALLNYTYSHSLDNSSNDVIAGFSNSVISAATDYASSDFDVRQSFSGALTVAVPSLGKSGVASQVTRDWSLDTVVVARTGFPVNTTLSAPSTLGPSFIRPDRVPGQPFYLYGAQCAQYFVANGGLQAGQTCPGGEGLNPAAFNTTAPVAQMRQGTLGRNAIPGFGLTQMDLSIARKFRITERLNLQFRADAFNVLNHPNFTSPGGYLPGAPFSLLSTSTLNTGLGGLASLFQEGGPRSLQLSLKLTF